MREIKFFVSVLLLTAFLGTSTIAGIGAENVTKEQKSTNEEKLILDTTDYTTILMSANSTDYLMGAQMNSEDSRKKTVLTNGNSSKSEIVLEKNDRKKTKSKKKATKKFLGTFKVTAYCSCSSCCGKSNGITASGTKATAGRTIAADTSKYPFGTKLVINGHTYTVEDRGGAINGNRIDMFFNSHSEALQWGVKYCDVYIKK